jgi:hypothetical protein
MRAITTLPNTESPDTDFPYGRFKDTVGSNAGTRVNEAMTGDWAQFFAKIMDEAAITPNGLPDSEYTGWQLYEALKGVFGGLRRIVIPIGTWDMDANQLISVSTSIPFANVRGYQFTINNDGNGNSYIGGVIGGLTPAVDAFIGGANTAGVLEFLLARRSGGGFDNSSFSGSDNRGYIIVDYVE